MAVLAGIHVGKAALPEVGGRAAVLGQGLALQSLPLAAGPGGVFPLGFTGQLMAQPAGVGLGIGMGDLDHRVVVQALDAAVGTVGVAPVGALDKVPPTALLDRPFRCLEDHAGPLLLGLGDVAGRLDKGGKLGVGDLGPVHPEGLDLGGPAGLFLGVAMFIAGDKFPAGNEDHAGVALLTPALGQAGVGLAQLGFGEACRAG